jgi:Putative cyclase
MSIRYLWFKYIVLISTTRKGNTFIPPLKGVGFLCFPYTSMLNNSKHEIKEKDTVVFSTGWEKRIKEKGNYYISNNPGLTKDAAEYLAQKKVNAVAIDGPNIDIGYKGIHSPQNPVIE